MVCEKRMGDLFGEKLLTMAELDYAVEEIAVEIDDVGALGYIFLFFLQFYLSDHFIQTGVLGRLGPYFSNHLFLPTATISRMILSFSSHL